MTRTRLSRLTLLLLPALVAAGSVGAPMRVETGSRLWVSGSSTVRSFECQAPAFEARLEATVPDAAAEILAGRQAVDSVRLTVPTAQMDCGNGTMNAHMRKALKATTHATITFVVDRYAVTGTAPTTMLALEGQLTLGGVTKPITVQATVEPAGAGAVRVVGAHELDMREFSLTPPTLMLGALKVAPHVTVRFDLLLKD